MKNGVEDFVVESTPVLDLKKQGIPSTSASFAPSSSASERVWDADRTEVYTDAEGESAVAALIGEHGETYPITTFPFVMGRGSECDLVLQGKGVSRRHAEIIFQSGRFVVNDLESLNGIKVNGYKVSRVILEENDAIKLGEVSLTFRSKEAGKTSPVEGAEGEARAGLFSRKGTGKPARDAAVDDTFGPNPLKKLAVNISLLIVAVLLSVVGYQMWGAQSPSGGIAVHAPSESPAASKGSEPAAIAEPNETSPEQTAPVVTTEVANKAQVPADTRTTPADVGDGAIAPPPSLAPPPSIAAPGVSTIEKSAPIVAKPAPAPRKEVAVAKPPAVSKPAVTPNVNQARDTLADAQQQYLSGNAAKAVALLKPLLDDRGVSGALRSQVQDAYGKYTALYEQYNAGQNSYLNGDKEGAFQTWVDFMDKESLALGGKKSTYTRNISSRVVSEYVTLGTEASRNGDHHKAYRMWQKALELEDNVAARIAIDNANNRAMQLYRQALRLEYVNTSKAKALWMEVTELLPPGTEYNTKASAKLAWYDKWGT